MNYIIFENDGELDERLISTFGVSVKETENPIGFFGTGLKYAISIMIREGQRFKLFSGTKEFVFQKQEITIRNRQVDAISMNGNTLSFTTHLGCNWKMWQAFREIWCNTMDEGGTVFQSSTIPDPQPGKTMFVLVGGEMQHIYAERNKIILETSNVQKIAEHPIQIMNHPSRSIFYRGIRVYDFDKPARYTYNVMSPVDLTEDRTVKYISHVMNDIVKAVAGLEDEGTIRSILTTRKNFVEGELGFSQLKWYPERVSSKFMEVLADEYGKNSDDMNKSAIEFFMYVKNKNAAKHYESEEMTSLEKKQLQRAVKVCKMLFDDFDKYKILVTKSLGEETVALADRSMDTMVVAKAVFKLGTKYLVSTLIEEYMHLAHGLDDCTRSMQTHLFNTITDLAENHVLREPI